MLAAIVALAFGAVFAAPTGAQEQGSVAKQTIAAGACAHVSDYVSTLVGTESKRELSTGNTYPAVARPWGMNFWSPQTGKMGDGWMYTYTADKIVGFKQTHQPSPWINDYGQFCIMPVTVSRSTVSGPAASGVRSEAEMGAGDSVNAGLRGSGLAFKERDRASWFSHKSETAKPYLYSVYLADYDVFAEVSAAQRGAMLRFAFPEEKLSYIVVDALDEGSAVNIDREHNRIIGYSTKNDGGVPENFKDWFVIESDTPFEYVATAKDSTLAEGTLTAAGEHTYALVGFKTVKGQKVTLRVASSFISIEQAMLNLREVEGKSFEALVAEGRQAWDDVLGRIQVEDLELTGKGAAGDPKGTVDNLRTFYSCLYRATLFPRDMSEINEKGERVHYSPYNGTICSGYLFTDTGFWDTFRSLFPLLNLVYPEMSERMQEGLVNTYNESGFLPEWASPGHRGCMAGGKKWYARVAGTYGKAGNAMTPKGVLENSQFNTSNIDAKFGFKPAANQLLKLQFQRNYSWNVGIPGGSAFPGTATATYTGISRTLFDASYEISKITDKFSSLKFSYFHQDIQRNVMMLPNSETTVKLSTGMTQVTRPDSITPKASHITNGGQIQCTFNLSENNTLIAGIDVWNRRMSSTREKYITMSVYKPDGDLAKTNKLVRYETPLPTSTFTSAGIYVQDEAHLMDGRLTLTAGGRIDDIHERDGRDEERRPEPGGDGGIL